MTQSLNDNAYAAALEAVFQYRSNTAVDQYTLRDEYAVFLETYRSNIGKEQVQTIPVTDALIDFITEITRFGGKYQYLAGSPIVADAYAVLRQNETQQTDNNVGQVSQPTDTTSTLIQELHGIHHEAQDSQFDTGFNKCLEMMRSVLRRHETSQRGEITLPPEHVIRGKIFEAIEHYLGNEKFSNGQLPTVTKVMEAIRPYLATKRESVEERPYPRLLSEDEKQSLLQKAEKLWSALETNELGGYSGINRPFFIVSEFKEVIEQYGDRDVGLTWSFNDLRKASKTQENTNQGKE